MKLIMRFDVLLLILLCIATLFVLAKVVGALNNVITYCGSVREIREACQNEVLATKNVFRMGEILRTIRKNRAVVKHQYEKLTEKLKCLLVWGIVYGIIWIIRLLIDGVMVFQIVSDFMSFTDMNAVRTALIILELVAIVNLLVSPIAQVYGKKMLANLGPELWRRLADTCDSIGMKVVKATLLFMEWVLQILLIGLLIGLLKKFGFGEDLILVTLLLLVYHYGVLWLVAKLIGVFNCKGDKNDAFRKEYASRMHRRLKSSSFITLIVMNIIADVRSGGETSAILYKAMGFVYLLDCYVEQRFSWRNWIKEKVKEKAVVCDGGTEEKGNEE